MKKYSWLLAILVSASTIHAGGLYEAVKEIEFSADTFAAYSVERGPFEDILKNSFAHGKFGTGIGLNAFFGRNVGLKLDSIVSPVDDVSGALVDYSSASFVLKFPTTIRVDPYALAGLGRNWDSERWNTHVAVGALLRLTEKVGINAEFRHVFESRLPDYDQIRFGLSYRF